MRIENTLTNYARGLAPDLQDRTAQFIAPEVVTGMAYGQYKDFGDRQAFEVYNTQRAIGGHARRIVFEETDQFFNAKPQALEVGIDDHERAQAGEAANILLLQQSKIKVLLSNANTGHAVKVMTAAQGAVSATSGVGSWGGADDPVAEIDGIIQELATEIGVMPNRVLFGIGAWATFRNNSSVIDRQPGSALIGLTTAQASNMFLNPGAQVHVATQSYEDGRRYATTDKVNVVGDDVWVFFNSDNPSVWDPSFMKTFRPARAGVLGNVVSYRDDPARSDIYAVDWAEDIKVTSAVCAARITVTTGS